MCSAGFTGEDCSIGKHHSLICFISFTNVLVTMVYSSAEGIFLSRLYLFVWVTGNGSKTLRFD